ncbi:hypothetical protein F5Y03DRAFT_29038 [Xylaria venustula]|nr:hypothetical protein F5Y03DRAFT_29038 [Xylaria venustula]
MLARLIDAVDFAIMPRYKVSFNLQPLQLLLRRFPIRLLRIGFEVSSIPSSERGPAGGQPRQSLVRPLETSSTFRVPSMFSSEESLAGGQPEQSAVRPPDTSSTFRVPSMSSSEESFAGGQPEQSAVRPLDTFSIFRVPSMSSSEESFAGEQPEQSAVRPPDTSSTFRVPSMSSSEESFAGGQPEQSAVRPLDTSSTFRVPSMSSSEGSLQREQMRFPIRFPIFPPAGGFGRENPEEAQLPKLPQNINAEGVREFQPFLESRVIYPLPDDLWGEDEEEL